MSDLSRQLLASGWFGDRARERLAVLRNLDPVVLLATAALLLCGLVFIGSATQDDAKFADQQGRQALFVACSVGIGFFVVLVHYARWMRAAWLFYGVVLLALLGLPLFAPVINGARRWYAFPGFSVQPSEFAKLAVVVAVAALLRFKTRARTFEGLFVPMLVAGVPAALILRQPDLSSALVFGPVLLAMCFVAGAPLRSILWVIGLSAVVGVVAYFGGLQDYQLARISAWWGHWGIPAGPIVDADLREMLRTDGYQPWQALIAMGAGGWTGFGIGAGPQNRYDFLPYRSEDYVFAVVGEETGWLGCLLVLGIFFTVVLGIFGIALRTRERFGRLVCVGIGTWLATQALAHVAVCAWLVPSTGLPMPGLSYGGSATLATLLGIALCLNIGARPEPVLSGDGFR
jgi:rod shape determining protein RodA